MTNNLTMRWIPVAGATGRVHLESVWVTLDEAPVATAPITGPAAQHGTETHAA